MACQEYQLDLNHKAIFVFDSCRLLWWGWIINSMCIKGSAAHSVTHCGFHWESGLLPVPLKPLEMVKLMLCSMSLSLICYSPTQARFWETGLLLCLLQELIGVIILPVQRTEVWKPFEDYQGPQQWWFPIMSSCNTKLTSFSWVSSKATRHCPLSWLEPRPPSFKFNRKRLFSIESCLTGCCSCSSRWICIKERPAIFGIPYAKLHI